MLARIHAAIIKAARGEYRFASEVPALFRRAIDEVIDSKRSGRFTIDELEKTEKTYLGTKIEILLRNFLKLQRGETLDVRIDGVEVDIKNTIRRSWTIPMEAVGHPCILIRTDERRALCWMGLLMIREEYLSPGKNRDLKRPVSSAAERHIRWMLESAPYPANFWEQIGAERNEIVNVSGGTGRLAMLFERVQKRPISRNVVEGLGQQKDAMKRIRKNGGARDRLSAKGIALLWGRNDQELIRLLGLPRCGADEFISYRPVEPDDIDLLRRAGHIK